MTHIFSPFKYLRISNEAQPIRIKDQSCQF